MPHDQETSNYKREQHTINTEKRKKKISHLSILDMVHIRCSNRSVEKALKKGLVTNNFIEARGFSGLQPVYPKDLFM